MLGLLSVDTAARMRISIGISIVLCIGVVVAWRSQSCRYWCKADHQKVYYCCPSGKSETWFVQSLWPLMSSPIFWVGVIGTSLSLHAHNSPSNVMDMPPMRTKLCPPMRTGCPRSLDWYDPPSYCDRDDECQPTEKCCYDVCLEHKTCKPAE